MTLMKGRAIFHQIVIAIQSTCDGSTACHPHDIVHLSFSCCVMKVIRFKVKGHNMIRSQVWWQWRLCRVGDFIFMFLGLDFVLYIMGSIIVHCIYLRCLEWLCIPDTVTRVLIVLSLICNSSFALGNCAHRASVSRLPRFLWRVLAVGACHFASPAVPANVLLLLALAIGCRPLRPSPSFRLAHAHCWFDLKCVVSN